MDVSRSCMRLYSRLQTMLLRQDTWDLAQGVNIVSGLEHAVVDVSRSCMPWKLRVTDVTC